MRFRTLIIWMKKIIIFFISFESNWHAFNWKSCSIILLNKQALRIQPPTHKFYGDVAIADISINHYTLYESNITHGFVSAGIHTIFSAHHHFTTFIWKISGVQFHKQRNPWNIVLRCKRFWEFVVNSCEFEVKDNKFIRLK